MVYLIGNKMFTRGWNAVLQSGSKKSRESARQQDQQFFMEILVT